MDRDTLFILHKKGLISDEVLATCLNEMYGPKANEVEKDAREVLVERTRQRAEENRKNIEEINRKNREEFEARQKEERDKLILKARDEEIAKMHNYLSEVTNSRGEKVYSEEALNDMSYVEMFSLYHQIMNPPKKESEEVVITDEPVVAEEIKEEPKEEVTKTREEIAKEMFEQQKQEKKDYLRGLTLENGERKFSDEKLDEIGFVDLDMEYNKAKQEAMIEAASQYKPLTDADLDGEKEDLKPVSEPEEIHATPLVDEEDEFMAEKDLNETAKNATTPEVDQRVVAQREATPIERVKYAESKRNKTIKFIRCAAVVAGFGLITFASPILGIGSYAALRTAVRNNKWNPENKFLNNLKEDMQNLINFGRGIVNKEQIDFGGKIK